MSKKNQLATILAALKRSEPMAFVSVQDAIILVAEIDRLKAALDVFPDWEIRWRLCNKDHMDGETDDYNSRVERSEVAE